MPFGFARSSTLTDRLLALVKQGKAGEFYDLLKSQPGQNLDKIIDDFAAANAGKTPWHIAAALGFSLFFVEPQGAGEQEIWKWLRVKCLAMKDQDGNHVLHHAVHYNKKTSLPVIYQKKMIVKQLVIMDGVQLDAQNNKLQTPLHFVAADGSYETFKVLWSVIAKNKTEKNRLLALQDQSGKKPYDLAAEFGHQRISDAMLFKAKAPKTKIETNTITFESLQNDAKNPHLESEKFAERFKQLKSMSYDQLMDLINLRILTLRKKNRRKFMVSALIGSLCPAATLAAFIGGFGGLAPMPFIAEIVTLGTLPFVYLPFVYTCYKVCMTEFSHTTAESIYLSWLALRLKFYEQQVDELLRQAKALELVLQEENLAAQRKLELKAELRTCKQKYKTLCEEMNKAISWSNDANSKPKLTLKFIKNREKFKSKKQLGVYDAKNNASWANRAQSIKAFLTYNTDVLCALGTGLTIAASITSIVLAKFGIAFLGAAIGGAMAGPAGPIVFGTILTVALAIIIGVAIYKASYKKEKAEMGKVNRELIAEYDNCKRASDLTVLQRNKLSLESTLDNVRREMNIERDPQKPWVSMAEKVKPVPVPKPVKGGCFGFLKLFKCGHGHDQPQPEVELGQIKRNKPMLLK